MMHDVTLVPGGFAALAFSKAVQSLWPRLGRKAIELFIEL